MTSPVWIDGPLEGQEYEVPADVVEQGMFRYGPDVVYTFTEVHFIEHRVIVGSTHNGIPGPDVLFRALTTPAAQRAAL